MRGGQGALRVRLNSTVPTEALPHAEVSLLNWRAGAGAARGGQGALRVRLTSTVPTEALPGAEVSLRPGGQAQELRAAGKEPCAYG